MFCERCDIIRKTALGMSMLIEWGDDVRERRSEFRYLAKAITVSWKRRLVVMSGKRRSEYRCLAIVAIMLVNRTRRPDVSSLGK